jgi:hypothetical protein
MKFTEAAFSVVLHETGSDNPIGLDRSIDKIQFYPHPASCPMGTGT